MPPTAKALTFLEMLARFSLRRHRKANAYRAPGWFRDLRLLDEQRPPESCPYLTTRSYGSTKGPRSAHIGLGRSAKEGLSTSDLRTDRQTNRETRRTGHGHEAEALLLPTPYAVSYGRHHFFRAAAVFERIISCQDDAPRDTTRRCRCSLHCSHRSSLPPPPRLCRSPVCDRSSWAAVPPACCSRTACWTPAARSRSSRAGVTLRWC